MQRGLILLDDETVRNLDKRSNGDNESDTTATKKQKFPTIAEELAMNRNSSKSVSSASSTDTSSLDTLPASKAVKISSLLCNSKSPEDTSQETLVTEPPPVTFLALKNNKPAVSSLITVLEAPNSPAMQRSQSTVAILPSTAASDSTVQAYARTTMTTTTGEKAKKANSTNTVTTVKTPKPKADPKKKAAATIPAAKKAKKQLSTTGTPKPKVKTTKNAAKETNSTDAKTSDTKKLSTTSIEKKEPASNKKEPLSAKKEPPSTANKGKTPKKLLLASQIKSPSILDVFEKEKFGTADSKDPVVIVDIPLHPASNADYLDENGQVVFNFAQIMKERFLPKSTNKDDLKEELRAKRNLLGQLNETTGKIDGIDGNEEDLDAMGIDDDEDDEDDNEEEDNEEDKLTSSPKKRSHPNKGKNLIGKYDTEDPFIDDSELAWEEQRAATKDGFFVYFGPLIEKGHYASLERVNGTMKRGGIKNK